MITRAAARGRGVLSGIRGLGKVPYGEFIILSRTIAEMFSGVKQVLSQDGKVSLRAYHRGNHIYIEVEDDGRGIDYERVKQSAIERGLVSMETADRLTGRDLREMLFHPGFSTAPVKTELAGRGVGLDVVRANVNALNGEIHIQINTAAATPFTLKVPLTLIISPALFVRCGTSNYALLLAVVEEIRRLRADETEDIAAKLLPKVRHLPTHSI